MTPTPELQALRDDVMNQLAKRIPPTFRTAAQPAIERLRRHFDVQIALNADAEKEKADLTHAATNAAAVDRAQLDLIRNMIDDMSGKPTKAEAIQTLAQIADLIGAGAIEQSAD